MRLRPLRVATLLTVLATVGACTGNGEEPLADGSAAATIGATRYHRFELRLKAFIAPIADHMIGDLGSAPTNAALHAFAAATNATFGEDPQSGDGPSRDGQYRSWLGVNFQLECQGSSAKASVIFAESDAGWEGPLHGLSDLPTVRIEEDGRFYVQARARPHPDTEPAFQAIHERKNLTIWQELVGRLKCRDDGNAVLAIEELRTSTFPSVRVWVTRQSDDERIGPELLAVDRPQGFLSQLWSLADPPNPPRTVE